MNKSYHNKIKKMIFIFIFLPVTLLTLVVVSALVKNNSNGVRSIIALFIILINISIYFFSTLKLPGILEVESTAMAQFGSEMMPTANCSKKTRELFTDRLEISEALKNINSQYSIISEESMKLLSDLDALKSALKKIKREEHAQNHVNQALLGLSNQFVIQVNSEGTIVCVNEVFLSRLGYSDQEIVGTSIISLIEQNDGVERNWSQILSDSLREPVYMSLKMKTSASNSFEYINFRSMQLKNNSYICVGKAINDEISLQSNILRKNRELEYVNQINSSLISNWDIKDLLDNIIKRIDYLFNIYLGGIYVLNSEKKWELEAYSSGTLSRKTIENINIENYISSELLAYPEIKTTKINFLDMNYLTLLPLEVDNEIMAIMAIGTIKQMSINDIIILKMFKNQAAMVIQRSMIYEQLRRQYFGTIEALVNVIEAKDKYTEGHSRRVSRFSVVIAAELGYSNEEVENIEIAGLLHDIGKIGIDQAILGKQGKLTDDEYEVIKQHPTKGLQILKSINFDDKIKDAILYHHLRYDLKGYPNAEIDYLPIYASIIGIADAFDAITSARSYSNARTKEDALKELIKYRGSQFTPELVDVLEKLIIETPNVIQEIIEDTYLS